MSALSLADYEIVARIEGLRVQRVPCTTVITQNLPVKAVYPCILPTITTSAAYASRESDNALFTTKRLSNE